MNAKFRAQTAARPRVTEIRRALAQVEREIANHTRAVARGDFASLETALRAGEQRRATLQVELASLDGNRRPGVVQLTPAALARHLLGQTEKLRSGENGRIREGIEQCWLRESGGDRFSARWAVGTWAAGWGGDRADEARGKRPARSAFRLSPHEE